MLIAIDFDGVLINHKDIPTREDWWKDKPHKGALESVKLLNKEHDLYVCTAREEHEWAEAKMWLRDNGFPRLEVTNKKKPYTDMYIDDRAVRFTNWQDIYKYLT